MMTTVLGFGCVVLAVMAWTGWLVAADHAAEVRRLAGLLDARRREGGDE